MKKWLNSLRLKWFIGTKALGFSTDFTQHLYRIYLNHSKVIHYRDGHPVFSLSTPALYSGPASNMMARVIYRGIQNKNIPNLMSFAVTDICNVRCSHCSFYGSVDDPTRTVMSREQAVEALRQAQELGVTIINIVGGEPLYRKDLPEILSTVDKNQSMIVLFSNGWLLEEQSDALRQAGVDGIYVSLDAANAEEHDRLRGLKGLFDKAMSGIQRAKKAGMTVGISTCMTPDKFANGEFDRMAELSRKAGVHELLVFDAMPAGKLKNRCDLIDNGGWIEEMIKRSEYYNADMSYPGVLIHAYAASHRSVGCSCGTSYFYLSPYGDVFSCDFNHEPFGDVTKQPLWQIWEKLSSDKDFAKAKWGGCKIKDSVFRETRKNITTDFQTTTKV